MFTGTITSENGSEYRLEYEIDASGVTITGVSPKDVKEVVIPSEIDGLPVTSIGGYAFYNCHGLTSITIPDSVTSIGDYAFRGCARLTSIPIPDSVIAIDEGAFSGCSGLTSITIPDSVTSIGSYTFSCCTNLTSITIPDSVTSIGNGAFYRCAELTSITIPDNVTSIGICAFDGCTGLTSVYAPSVQYVDKRAFGYCTSLRSVELAPNAIRDDTAFQGSGLEDEYCYNEEER